MHLDKILEAPFKELYEVCASKIKAQFNEFVLLFVQTEILINRN